MNKRALLFGCLYSAFVIAFKLFIILGGYTFTKFGFNYSILISVLMIIPFYYITVKLVRDRDYGGIIGGKEAARLTMTVLAVSVVLVSIYNYIEFNWKFYDLAVQYYNSNEYLTILKKQQAMHPDKIKVESFPAIVQEQVRDLSAFKATTGKLIPMLFIGIGAAFVTSLLMKRSPK